MTLLRRALLRASESRWLAEQSMRRGFTRRAVLRFMPGEDLDDAIRAATHLSSQGITAVLTQLGEDVTERAEAEAVAAHYVDVFDRIKERSLRAHVSIKLTQLGLDIDPDFCLTQVQELARAAQAMNSVLWIDMERSDLVDHTLDIFRKVLSIHQNLGVCLQAYLHRTPADLESLIALGARIRLVKGAYREPPTVALARKSDVDARFLELARRLLQTDARRAKGPHGIATHDLRLVRAVHGHARARGVSTEAFEFQMLYGIRRDDQVKLAADGFRVRTLISYGTAWFPWYMRRLAERPANLWFVLRSVVA